MSGTSSNFPFSGSHPGNASTTWTYSFTGALNGSEITGTFTLTVRSPNEFGQFAVPVTLRH